MSYRAFLAGEPLIVTVAPTGGVHGKEAHPGLPETPGEVAEAAAACEVAGASIVHLHAVERTASGRSRASGFRNSPRRCGRRPTTS